MRAKITALLTIVSLAALYRVSGRPGPVEHPADLRDAVKTAAKNGEKTAQSSPVFDDLVNAAPAAEAAVPVPSPAKQAAGAPPSSVSRGQPVNEKGAAAGPGDGAYAGQCGPDVTGSLADLLERISKAYDGWGPELRARNCGALDVDAKLSATTSGFDIYDLRPDLYRGFSSIPSSEFSWEGNCRLSLSVDGNCYRHEEINYVMWGLMTRLCDKSPAWAKLKVRAYLLYYYSLSPQKKKGEVEYPGETANKIAWTQAGYDGWPKTGAPSATLSECAPSTLPPSEKSRKFSAYWGESMIQ